MSPRDDWGLYVRAFVALMSFAAVVGLLRDNARLQRVAANLGDRRLSRALGALTRRLHDRIAKANSSADLLTEHSVRAIGVEVERRYRSAVLTDKIICEAIRAVAYDIEEEYEGPQLVFRLELLNGLLRSFNDTGPPLLSIAKVDRLIGYRHAQPIACVVASTLFSIPLIINVVWVSPVLWAIASCGFVLLLFLTIGAVRAVRVWSRPVTSETSRPSVVLDLFLMAACSRTEIAELFWHCGWAWVWENIYARDFLESHEYRLVLAHRVRERLRHSLSPIVDEDCDDNQINQVIARAGCCYRQLWEITGRQYFKDHARQLLRHSKKHNRDQVIATLVEAAKTQRLSLREWVKSLNVLRRRLFLAAGGKSAEGDEIAQTLSELSLCAQAIWREFGDAKYAKLGQEYEDLLRRYKDTGVLNQGEWLRRKERI